MSWAMPSSEMSAKAAVPRRRVTSKSRAHHAGAAVPPSWNIDAPVDSVVLESLDEGVVAVDCEGRLKQMNASASAILGIDPNETLPAAAWWAPLWARCDTEGKALSIAGQVLQTRQGVRGVDVQCERPGRTVSLVVNCLPLRSNSGVVEGVVLSFVDVTEHRRERRELIDTQERLREAHDVAQLASWEWQPETGDVIVFQALAGAGMAARTRVTLDEWLAMLPTADHQMVQDDFAAFVRGERGQSVNCFQYVLPSGLVWLEVRSRAVCDREGRLICVRGTAQDVSDQERTRHALTDTRDFLQATLDSLTTQIAVLDDQGEIVMVNRAWDDFAVADGAGSASAGVGANYLAVCDAAGEDQSAAQAAAGLRAILAGVETEFSMDYACHSPDVRRWFELRATRYEGTGPIRIVVAHENISKRKAEERLVAVDLDKLAWVGRIKEALTNDRFVLHVQPIVELATDEIVQRELLIRMRSSEGSPPGLIAPGYFLPVAEEFGLITEIDRWVIDRAAELAATGMPVELNVSGRSISDPRLVDYIKAALERTDADPGAMVFEITETTLVNDDVSARAFVARLHELGCKIALDDFGTGYGGFTYLKQLPIDHLKIDIEFVSDLSHNPASRTVVQAIVKLAHGFDLKTVAEGVEDEETMDVLRELDVDYAQGYHIGRPAPLVRQPPAIHKALA